MKTAQEKIEARVQRKHEFYRTLTTGKVYSDVAKHFQKYIRAKSKDSFGMCACCTCGRRQDWKDMDAGHYITRSNKATLLDERNVAVQCVTCNRFGYGEKAKHKEYILRTYGQEVLDELETARHPRNYYVDREELARLCVYLMDEIKKLES